MRKLNALVTSIVMLAVTNPLFGAPLVFTLTHAQISKMAKIIRSSSEQTVEKVPSLGTVFCYPDYCTFPLGENRTATVGLGGLDALSKMMKKGRKTAKSHFGQVYCTTKYCELKFSDADKSADVDKILGTHRE